MKLITKALRVHLRAPDAVLRAAANGRKLLPFALQFLQRRWHEDTQDAIRHMRCELELWSADNDRPRTRRASMLLGTLVVDEKGNRIGNIEDVMYDNDGKVSHELVSGDVVLKVADRHVVLPWDTLEVPILVATALAALPMLE